MLALLALPVSACSSGKAARCEEAFTAVVEAVLRAFAASPDLEDGWSTPQKYPTEDRSIVVTANHLGFNGSPKVGEVRERYGTTPG